MITDDVTEVTKEEPAVMEDAAPDVELGSASAQEDEARGDDLSQYLHPRFKWYIVNTYSGSEETAKIALKERIERSEFMDHFGDIYVPKTTVERTLKSGKKKLIDKTSFPGYIIVQMEMTDDSMAVVANTPKITGFVGNRRSPRPMEDNEVLRLMAPSAAVEARVETSKVNYSKGESVKVTDGPFTNFDGVVDEVKPEKMKVKVLVSIFGRETPVELGYNQIEKI